MNVFFWDVDTIVISHIFFMTSKIKKKKYFFSLKYARLFDTNNGLVLERKNLTLTEMVIDIILKWVAFFIFR